jgi:uncharacterized sulfatase
MSKLRHILRHTMLAFALLAPVAAAADDDATQSFDYHLEPRLIAPATWVLTGRNEDFSVDNGGNIVNTAFVATGAGVVVIDSGPSRRYGEQMRAAIARVTPEPVVAVLITHHHPDHFLGNQAFPPATLRALPATITDLGREGGAFTDNMYRPVGDWMRDTDMVMPKTAITPGRSRIGGHEFEFLALAGHTNADLAVFDRTTGVLFAGDLVFNQRAPTTPHADVARWMASLTRLEALPFKQVVPGHGPVAADAGPIRFTRAYLEWLSASIARGARNGMDMVEMLQSPVAPEFRAVAVVEAEYARSISHLYPAAEKAVLEGRRGK